MKPEKRTKKRQWSIWLAGLMGLTTTYALAAEVGGKPEKTDVVVTYAQASGAFTPIWVANDAGLFKKYGLNIWGAKAIATVQDLKGKAMAASTPRAALDTATREALKRNGLIPDRDVQILYVQTVPAILSAIIGGKTAAGTLSAPNTLKAKEAGLNLLVDIGKLNIPALQVAYGTTEKYLKNNPNTVYAFLKAIAEGVVLARKEPAVAKKAISKYVKIDDAPTVDGTFEAFAPYWAMNLAVRPEAIRGQFDYLDEKEFPNAKNADPKEFFDNSFVNALEKTGFFQKIGFK